MAQTAVQHALAESFVIEGAQPLNGRITAAGNKNGALPILAACLLTDEPVVLSNVPKIRDVETMLELLVDVGVEVDWQGPNELRVHAADVRKVELDEELCSRIRASILLAGPLLARCGRAVVPPPGGDVIGRRREDVVAMRPMLDRLGMEIEVEGTIVRVPDGQELLVQDDLGGAIPTIDDGPWPQFPADLTSIALAVATQANGTVLIFEKMFENRLFFVDKLVSMGARIILCDPHRAVVTGPARLYGQRMASPDIRAGMAMLIASLCAEGTSTIGNVGEIDRGYERIDERLRQLGAQIERVEG